MNNISLSRLKTEFYEWCGLLSEEEIIKNKALIRTMERIEKLFKITEGEK